MRSDISPYGGDAIVRGIADRLPCLQHLSLNFSDERWVHSCVRAVAAAYLALLSTFHPRPVIALQLIMRDRHRT
jgi:hypothetical protein